MFVLIFRSINLEISRNSANWYFTEIFRSHFRELPVVTSILMHFRELPVPDNINVAYVQCNYNRCMPMWPAQITWQIGFKRTQIKRGVRGSTERPILKRGNIHGTLPRFRHVLSRTQSMVVYLKITIIVWSLNKVIFFST